MIIARFAARHLRCVARVLGGDPAVVTSVPSTRASPRQGIHPLEAAVTRVGALASRYAPLLVRGSAYVDHNRADDDAFAVQRVLSRERVLVVDDTLTTGARLQSTVSAGASQAGRGKSAQLWELAVEVVANPYTDRFMHLEIRQIRHREEFNSG